MNNEATLHYMSYAKPTSKKSATFNFECRATDDINEFIEALNTYATVPIELSNGYRKYANVKEIFNWLRFDIDADGEESVVDEALKDYWHIKKPSTSNDKYPYKWHYIVKTTNVFSKQSEIGMYKLQMKEAMKRLGIELKDIRATEICVQNLNAPADVDAAIKKTVFNDGKLFELTRDVEQIEIKVSKKYTSAKTDKVIKSKKVKKKLKNIEDSNIKTVSANATYLKHDGIIETENGWITFNNLDRQIESSPEGTIISQLGCPICNPEHSAQVAGYAFAYASPDGLYTMIKCGGSACANKPIYIIDSRYGGTKNYMDFCGHNKMIIDKSGAIFIKDYQNTKGRNTLTTLKRQGAFDEWADRPVYVKVMNGEKKEIIKTVSVVDIALKGQGAIKLAKGEQIDDNAFLAYANPIKRYHGLRFRPDDVKDTSELNLWGGFPIEPAKGNIKPFTDFLYSALDKTEANYVLDFFAHLYQYPQNKPRYALIFTGGKGTGKNTISDMLGKHLLHHDNFYGSDDKSQFFGKHNTQLERNLLAVMNELTYGGEHSTDSILKGMITETSRSIEPKGIDKYMVDNFSRIVTTSNEAWSVPAKGKDERRYCVITFKDTPETYKDKIEAVYKWFKKDGSKEALMHMLMSREVPSELNKAPETAGLKIQLEHSLAGAEKFIGDAISNGYFGLKSKNSYNQKFGVIYIKDKDVKRSDLYECFKLHYPNHKTVSNRSLYKSIKTMIGAKHLHQKDGDYFVFLSPKESSELFEEATNVKIHPVDEWESEYNYD